MTENAEPQETTKETKKSGSFLGRLLIALFMGGVVMAECLFAYFWLPSAEQVAAQVESMAEEAQADQNGDEENSEDEDVRAVEVDLGAFTITNHRLAAESTFRTDFHLFATVPEESVDEFNELFLRNTNRFRDQVIEEIQGSDVDDLVDSGLGLIKRRILAKSNALLGKPLLRSVLFTEYTFVEL